MKFIFVVLQPQMTCRESKSLQLSFAILKPQLQVHFEIASCKRFVPYNLSLYLRLLAIVICKRGLRFILAMAFRDSTFQFQFVVIFCNNTAQRLLTLSICNTFRPLHIATNPFSICIYNSKTARRSSIVKVFCFRTLQVSCN